MKNRAHQFTGAPLCLAVRRFFVAVLLTAGPGCGGQARSGEEGAVAPPGLPVSEPLEKPSTDYAQCPEEPPPDGEACAESGLQCTYGEAERVDCRTKARCVTGKWTISSGQTCSQPEAGDCPAEQPLPGDPCQIRVENHFGDSSIPCVYSSETACVCRSCPEGRCVDGPGWQCEAPPAASCPRLAPNLGDECDNPGRSCSYGDPCLGGGSFICRQGYWHDGGAGCDG